MTSERSKRRDFLALVFISKLLSLLLLLLLLLLFIYLFIFLQREGQLLLPLQFESVKI